MKLQEFPTAYAAEKSSVLRTMPIKATVRYTGKRSDISAKRNDSVAAKLDSLNNKRSPRCLFALAP
ncbi:hypothetical protein EIZ48_27960 [Photobacterium alginatilyticum]|uniref:Uncharacterized protein n=1 Tax=Photobacterium alginatilyticum TaxID=1775171 RepID=A0ABW9YR97_9GAMM|nr:hypothetical protein [Photobacterium alginatilyticum]